MKLKARILPVALSLPVFLVCASGTTALADGAGYWRYSDVRAHYRNVINPEAPSGMDRRYITGGASGMILDREFSLYNPRAQSDERRVFRHRYQAQMNWEGLHEVLVPGREYELQLRARLTTSVHPEMPRFGATLAVTHTREAYPAGRLDSIPRDRQCSLGFWRLEGESSTAVSASQGIHQAQATAMLAPPSGGAARDEYAIRFSTGMSGIPFAFREHIYTYRWQPGAVPPDEQQDRLLPTDDLFIEVEDGAIITSSKGDVSVKIGEDWVPVGDARDIPGGFTIRTGPGGMATMILPDGTAIRMKPGTTIAVPHLTGAPEGARPLIMVIMGRIWANLRRDDLDIGTPRVVIAVRGTTLAAEVHEDGSERFDLFTGETAVRPLRADGTPDAERQVVLRPAQTAALARGATSLDVRDLSDEELAAGWIEGYRDMSEDTILPTETEGRPVIERESNDWGLRVYERPTGRHGVLVFEGLPVRDVGRAQLASPFGLLRYHGWPASDREGDSGWLPAE